MAVAAELSIRETPERRQRDVAVTTLHAALRLRSYIRVRDPGLLRGKTLKVGRDFCV